MTGPRRPRHSWRFVLPLGSLVLLHLACLFGGFLSPNSALEQDRGLPWAPPTQLRFLDADGRLHFRPFAYPLVPDAESGYQEDRSRPSPLRLFVRGDRYRLLGILPTDVHLLGVEPPAKLLFLGTDNFGRDVFARVLVGGRISLFVGLVAAILALALGTVVGSIAGISGGNVDAVLMRAVELFLALPWLYLLLAGRAFLPLDISTGQAFLLLTLTIGMIGWARPALLLRSIVLSAKTRPFVAVGHSIGASRLQLFTRHIWPQLSPNLATQLALLAPAYILAEVTLSFLGLGFSPPTPTWGSLLAQLQSYSVLVSYFWMLTPLLLLILTAGAYLILQASCVASKHISDTTLSA